MYVLVVQTMVFGLEGASDDSRGVTTGQHNDQARPPTLSGSPSGRPACYTTGQQILGDKVGFQMKIPF